jgi:AcrR family transcriptional regulator
VSDPAASPRERVLDAAGELFYRHGFVSVGVDTIVRESGVGKMTLYRHFSGKEDLILAYLERANQRFWQWFSEAQGSGGARERLERLFDAVGRLAGSPRCLGCTFQHAAADFPQSQHAAHQVAAAHKRSVLDRLRDLAHEVGCHEPDEVAAELLLLMDGAFVSARMFGRSGPAGHVGDAARHIIQTHCEPRSGGRGHGQSRGATAPRRTR